MKNNRNNRVQQGRAQQAEFEIAIEPPARSAAPERHRVTVTGNGRSMADFMHHMRGRYPVRLHRMKSDARWLRKQARKFGANPDEAVARMPW